MSSAPIVVAGAGPAGMMLAYQLASNGHPVRVLERHKDFEREFRGEFVQPSVIEAFESLGILEELRRRGGVQPIRAVRMHLGTRAFASSFGPKGGVAGLAIHQPSLLALLDEQCRRYPGYALDFGARAEGLVVEGGRVTGVRARIGDREQRIDARLVVVCAGRNTALRKEVSLDAAGLEPPYSLLWLRFDVSTRPELFPDTLDGFVTRRAFCVLYPTYGRRVQLMWRRRKKHPLDWKSGTARLREELLEDVPEQWRALAHSLDDGTERQVLRVICDRLQRWWAPGVLFLGDAAHTMSPIGGQGVSAAVRDAIVAANHLLAVDPTRAVDDAMLAAIETERVPEIEQVQAFQTRAGRIVDAPRAAQWLMANAVIPLVTRLQGASYLHALQFGHTNVSMTFPVPLASGATSPSRTL